jgi:hypothetical protein
VARGLLLCDAVERAVVVKAEIARVDDVVCAGIGGELVERLEVAWTLSVRWGHAAVASSLTSHVRNAQHAGAALLDHAALIGEQWDSARRGPGGGARSTTVGEVAAGVGARLVRRLLMAVSGRSSEVVKRLGARRRAFCTY